jgi:hypothetical protein
VAASMLLTAELQRLLQFLEAEGIRALPMKGPALASYLYAEPMLRSAVDLDFLVQKSDLKPLAQKLQQRGYTLTEAPGSLEDQRYLNRDSEFHFVSETVGVAVEIHWRIVPEQRFCSDFLWERVISTAFLGAKCLALPPEELLFLLCVHGGAKHQWAFLKWISDIAAMAATKSIDWSYLLKLAQRCGEQRTLMVALCLIHRLFAIPLPADLLRKIYANPVNVGFVGLIQGRLFREDSGLPGFREWLEYVGDLGARSSSRAFPQSGWRQYPIYLLAVMTPEFLDRNELHLPRSLSFLHYGYRPFRLFRRHGWKLVERLK